MRKTFVFVAAAISISVLSLMTPSRTVADAVVSVQAPATVAQGSSFAVDVLVAQVSDLYSLQFDLSFNPAVLQATTVLEGAFLQTGGSTFFIPGAIDNTAGNVTFNADTLLGPIPGVAGSGTLLEFDFTALANGTSLLGISNLTLLDSQGNSISGTTKDGSVTVGGGAVAEPSSLLLLLSGIGSLALLGVAKRL
jgi:hypothetical protein